MAKASKPPDLGSQLDDILAFVNNEAHIRGMAYQIRTLPDGPPACELGTGPGKSYVSHVAIVAEDALIPRSRIHFDFKGRAMAGSRECPHCNSICYNDQAHIGDKVECFNCGRAYVWHHI